MDRDPARWRRGVVIIRSGITSLGGVRELDALSRDPMAPAIQAAAKRCAQHIERAVAQIHSRHPATRVVLVGVLDNADWPPNFERWRDGQALANIRAGLDVYDAALKQMAKADPRVAFFDDRAWFAEVWGRRAKDGTPAYRSVEITPALRVTLTQGDHPRNAVLGDGHAGTVWNTLWAQSMVDLLNRQFGAGLTPVGDDEVREFLAPIARLP